MRAVPRSGAARAIWAVVTCNENPCFIVTCNAYLFLLIMQHGYEGDIVKVKADLKTLELPGVKRAVGRPPKPDAMTGAQRQALRRQRLREAGVLQLNVDVPADVMRALSKFVEFKDLTQGEVVARVLRDRLLRKR